MKITIVNKQNQVMKFFFPNAVHAFELKEKLSKLGFMVVLTA